MTLNAIYLDPKLDPTIRLSDLRPYDRARQSILYAHDRWPARTVPVDIRLCREGMLDNEDTRHAVSYRLEIESLATAMDPHGIRADVLRYYPPAEDKALVDAESLPELIWVRLHTEAGYAAESGHAVRAILGNVDFGAAEVPAQEETRS